MKRNKHSLSNYKLLSMNQGDLVPIGLTEVLPGDTIQQATSALIRVSPLVTPVMHPVHAKIHHWFVPHRIVWDDWEKFITGGPDGMDNSAFPTIDITGANPGDLSDYLGAPPIIGTQTVSALPFRGYAAIFNEWYRDQDLQSELVVSKASGLDTTTNTTLQKVGWAKDYFTTARPWTSKGPAVTIPLSGIVPVTADGHLEIKTSGATPQSIRKNAGGDSLLIHTGGSSAFPTGQDFEYSSGLEADLSSVVGAAEINELREAFAIMRYQEARARYGSRYTEYLSYLGVKSSDARLQRPEYLGGGKQTIQFSEVLQTAEGDDPVGTLRGHGIGAMRSNRYRKFFEEHGYVFSFISVMPIPIYTQGLARHWNRRTKEDFWQKELEHVGSQSILKKELMTTGTSTDNDEFGYQDRYAEYRGNPNTVAGEMRTTLSSWHMARIFQSTPTLNASFVQGNPTNRIYASQSTDQLYVMANHSVQARRLVSRSGGNSYVY